MTHEYQTLSPSSKYTQRICPITRRQLQPKDQVVICHARDSAILAEAFNEAVQEIRSCPVCKVPSDTMTHEYQTLSPSSKYTRRNCPITRRQLRPKDRVVICHARDSAILAEAFNEAVQEIRSCPMCNVPIVQPPSAPPPRPVAPPSAPPPRPTAPPPSINVTQPMGPVVPARPASRTRVAAPVHTSKRASCLPSILICTAVLFALMLIRTGVIQPWAGGSTTQATPTLGLHIATTAGAQPAAAQPVAQTGDVSTWTATNSTVLWSDDFSDTSSGWEPDYRSGNDWNGYRDGGYGFTIVSGSPHMLMWDILPNPVMGDAVVDVDVTLEVGEGWVGLVLAFDGSPQTLIKSRGYLVMVSHKGALVIEERSGGPIKRLEIDKSRATLTPITPITLHHLTIVRQQGTLIVALDGNELGRAQGSDLGVGQIGLVIESPAPGKPLSVLYDNLRVSQP